MRKNRSLSKRHFQLLEVMVAVFLILLCAVPTLRIYTNMYKEQAKILRLNECDHLAHLIHAKIVEQLYKRTIPLEEILAGKQAIFVEEDIKRLSYEASYDLSVLEPKTDKGKEKASKYLAQLIIKMKDLAQEQEPIKVYDYLVYIDRGQRDKKTKDTPPIPEEQDKAHPNKQPPNQGGNKVRSRKQTRQGSP